MKTDISKEQKEKPDHVGIRVRCLAAFRTTLGSFFASSYRRVWDILTFGDQDLVPSRAVGVREGQQHDDVTHPQDHQDTMLEIQRSQALDGAAIRIQRVLRGHKYRCQPPKPS